MQRAIEYGFDQVALVPVLAVKLRSCSASPTRRESPRAIALTLHLLSRPGARCR